MVVKAGHTDNKAFEHTVNNLQNIDAPLGGIILNAVTSRIVMVHIITIINIIITMVQINNYKSNFYHESFNGI